MIWKLVRLVTLGALVAAVVAAPAFATESQTSKLVQIGGQLVPPSQLSQFESQLGQPVSRSSQLVQIGGQLVPPSQLSSAERQLSAAWLAANGSSGSSSHVLRAVGYGAVALFTVALLVAAGTVARRRYEPTTA